MTHSTLSVRGGGHSLAGHTFAPSGVLLKTARMSTVSVLPGAEPLVRIGSGATWGMVAHELAPHGLAISSGDTASVGVAGLTLAGGIGRMARHQGLAIDSLVSAQVVTAQGDTVEASEHSHPELFWAIRGGGGNFGVLTQLTFRPRRIKNILYGDIEYEPVDVAGLVARWADEVRGSDDRLTTVLTVSVNSSRTSSSVNVRWCYASDDEGAARSATDRLRRLTSLRKEAVKIAPYSDVLEDVSNFRADHMAMRNAFVPILNDRVISRALEFVATSAPCVISFRGLGGAIAQVPETDTAYAHRTAETLIAVTKNASEDDADAVFSASADQIWAGISSRSDGAYVGFLDGATQDEIKQAYPEATLRRLSAVKRLYDPTNIFRNNHNVLPFPEPLSYAPLGRSRRCGTT